MPILITRTDGGVSVMRLTHPSHEAKAIANWKVLHPGEYVSHTQCDVGAIPLDRSFRAGWKAEGTAIGFDMGKCRSIHRDRLRGMRAPLLLDLDVQFMRAVEAGDGAAQVVITAKKQALRDVTADPGIDAAQNPDQLKAVIPACLK